MLRAVHTSGAVGVHRVSESRLAFSAELSLSIESLAALSQCPDFVVVAEGAGVDAVPHHGSVELGVVAEAVAGQQGHGAIVLAAFEDVLRRV